MADTNTTINLEGTDWISDIPGVYFDATSSLVKYIGNDASASKYIGRIGFGTGTVIDLTVNIAEDPDNPGKIIASTVAANGIVYVLGGYAADVIITDIFIGAALAITGAATAPVWLTVAGVGAAVAATTYFGSDLKDFVYTDLKNSLSDFEEYGFHSPEVVGTVTKDVFIAQSASNDPNFCKNIFQDYVNYRQITEIKSGSESFLYNQLTKNATISTSTTSEKEAVEVILKETQANQITINNHTADVATPTNLQLRNALTSIDDHQFLLSNILIKVGEKLDMGAAGIITVSSGDTLSQLAVQHLDGNAVDATREAVLLNPWLADYGQIIINNYFYKVDSLNKREVA